MPMLIILGGLPGTGKTAIAQQLARELGAVYLRIDSRDDNFVFASPTLDGKRPLWGQTMKAKFVKPAAIALEIHPKTGVSVLR